MAVTRSYRWLLVILAVAGLLADQSTKYGVFRWLYNGRLPMANGKFESWVEAKSWYPADGKPDAKRSINGGRYDLLPGWFGFIAEYSGKPDDKPWTNRLEILQTWSAPQPEWRAEPDMPHVNRGALFGMGGDSETGERGYGNTVFAVVSFLAALGIIAWATLRGKKADRWMCAALGLILGGTVGNCYDRIVFDGVRDFLYFYKINWPVFNVADCCLVGGAIILLGHAFFMKSPKAMETTAPAVTG